MVSLGGIYPTLNLEMIKILANLANCAIVKLPWVDPAHSGEPLTSLSNDHTRPIMVTACTSGHSQVTHSTLGADPGEPRQSYLNVSGQIGVDPGKLNERTHC